MGEGYPVHSGGNHVWLKRDGQAERLASMADRSTTRYRDWNAQVPVLPDAGPEHHLSKVVY